MFESLSLEKACWCNILINTATSYIVIIYNQSRFRYGSIYFTKYGSVQEEKYPHMLLRLSKKGKSILEEVVKTNNFWFHPPNTGNRTWLCLL